MYGEGEEMIKRAVFGWLFRKELAAIPTHQRALWESMTRTVMDTKDELDALRREKGFHDRDILTARIVQLETELRSAKVMLSKARSELARINFAAGEAKKKRS